MNKGTPCVITWRCRTHQYGKTAVYRQPVPLVYADWHEFDMDGGSVLRATLREVIPVSQTKLSPQMHRTIGRMLDKWDTFWLFIERLCVVCRKAFR